MSETLENHMVIDSLWEWNEKPEPSEEEELLRGSGYEEIGTGIFVAEEDAYKYALERISQDEEERKEFIEWFYSGNWIKED